MIPNLRRVLRVSRLGLPLAVIGFLVVFSVVPLRLPHYTAVAPNWVLAAVFYFASHRSDLVPSWTAFVLGVLFDVLSGGPLGLSALVMLLVREAGAILAEPLRGRPFLLSWAAFGIVALAAQMLGVLLATALAGTLVALPNVVFQLMLTVVVYPALALLLGVLARPLGNA
jgi:rod shape-determining protein MreD